jgi:RNA 2',3'-cyclic 3'-phosphodiesterase
MPGEIIRAFIAVPVPEPVRAELARAAGETMGDLNMVRPMVAGGIHATLKFLGDFDLANLNRTTDLLRLVAKKTAAFRLTVQGVGGFPDLEYPRVIYADLAGETDRIIALAAEVDKVAVALGYKPETRPYSPHLTLARVKAPKQFGLLRKRLRALEGRSYGEMPVEEIVLYRSDLRPEGARYTPLAGARLK